MCGRIIPIIHVWINNHIICTESKHLIASGYLSVLRKIKPVLKFLLGSHIVGSDQMVHLLDIPRERKIYLLDTLWRERCTARYQIKDLTNVRNVIYHILHTFLIFPNIYFCILHNMTMTV